MQDSNPFISIIIPLYNCSDFIDELYKRLTITLNLFCKDYEIIFINDGSPQNEWHVISEVAQNDKKVKGLNLSRNFGQHNAITAGLNHMSGDWAVVMDGDLQDRPEEIKNLYAEAVKGHDIVFARRINRKHSFTKIIFSKLFHMVYRSLSGIKSESKIGNFGIYGKKVVNEFNKMNEFSRSFPSLIHYLGFKYSTIDVAHDHRKNKKTAYTFFKSLSLAENAILSNSNKPLKVTIVLGFVMSAISFLFALYNVVAKFLGFITVQGYTATIFSIWFVGGLILFMFGIVGLYIGKIVDQVKNRQLYILKDKINI